MDKAKAIQLLDETFNKEFDVLRFSRFIRELLNIYEMKNVNNKSFTGYEEYIDSYLLLGTYEDRKKVIDIIAVKLKRTNSVDRTRAMQRNFISKYLSRNEKEAALVAFYGDDPQDWRFSFVKIEYNLLKDEEGRVKVVEESTPVKRYSFLVGKNEPNHTCKSRFVSLLFEERVNPSIEEIEEAFSVDKVTKEFFEQYKEIYLNLKEEMDKILEQNKTIKKEFDDNYLSTMDFSKKLLGQLVFIYFLQKKGWLGVSKNDKGKFQEWGTGPKNFVRRLFNKEIVEYDNFFNDILEPLFYEALAKERDDDYYRLFKCKIPFLNGGLFEPINDYDWLGTDILISNELFEKILNMFDRFNFTVKEDEPLEKEVAVDPEILGKVFENLLEIKDRKSSGAFYTPREIVHYMCQESLINYLGTNLECSQKEIESFIRYVDYHTDNATSEVIPKYIRNDYAKVDQLLRDIKIVDPAVGSGAFPVGMMLEIVKARSILTPFFDKEFQQERTNYSLKREAIENSLYGVDIDASAIDIAKLRFWLSLIVDEVDMKNIKPLPNLDHKLMCGNSLLEEFEGVKLFDDSLLSNGHPEKNFEIEKIRKEMSILYQEVGEIHTGKRKDNGRAREITKQLKTLEKKKAELLSGKKETQEQVTLDDALLKRKKESKIKLKELKELQHKYFNEQNRRVKKDYAQQIDKIEWEFIEETLKESGNEEALRKLQKYKKDKSKPFFLWKLYFSEVFLKDNPGFDVVIGNPPYVSTKGIEESDKRLFLSAYGFSDDLYNHFFFKGFYALRRDGFITYISSKTYWTIQTKRNLRDLLQSKKIIEIYDTASPFEAAMVDTAVIAVKNTNVIEDYIFTFSDGKENLLFPKRYKININIYRFSNNNTFFIPTKSNMEIYNKYNQKIISLLGNYWDKIETSKKIELNKVVLEKYRDNLKPGEITLLGLITEGGQGLATANNGRFVGVYETSDEAKNIIVSRPKKLLEAVTDNKIKEISISNLSDAKSFLYGKKELEIRKLFDSLKEKYGRDIFGKGYIYRIIMTSSSP